MDKNEIILMCGEGAQEVHFEQLFAVCLKKLGALDVLEMEERGTVTFDLIDDVKMREINKKYRGIDKPTDVVSLSYRGEIAFPTEENLVGEIFISVETAQRQADESGHTLQEELDFLFVHGVLHVFGFDHQTEEERANMFELQDQILS